MQNEMSKDEMKKLLNFMQRIENFERLNNFQIWAVERLTWGLLLIAAGILDFVILWFTHEFIGWITTLMWFLILVIALLLSNFQRRNVVLTTRKRKYSFYARTQHYWIGLAMALVFIFGYTDLNHLTFPVIAGMIGIVMFVDNFLPRRKITTYTSKIIYYVTPVLFILTSIINIVGFLVIGEIFELYQGLVFGCITGLALAYGAFLLKNVISRNKIAVLDSFTA
ncbi:MAG: hypothetical protein ACFFDS_06155 [Candidatus Thorarchaeota archaeon]